MKKNVLSTAVFILSLFLIFTLTSCSETIAEQPSSEVSLTDTAVPASDVRDALWETAVYTQDTELGQGAKKITVEVIAGEKSVVFIVNTDKDTVGEALLENNLVVGEEGAYGLYIKTVNGILADYDIDGSYWMFNINGEAALTGVDGARITEDESYQLVYTK